MSERKTIEWRKFDDPWTNTPRAFGIIEYKTDDRALEPVRSSAGAAGWDLYTVDDVELFPYRSLIVGTGIKAALPVGTVLAVLPRSGYSIKNQIVMPNSIGVIDEDYRGTIGISMMWTPQIEHNLLGEIDKETGRVTMTWSPDLRFRIPKFTRIAQALLLPYLEQEWRRVDALSETDRGAGGFGHTGTGPDNPRSSSERNKVPR